MMHQPAPRPPAPRHFGDRAPRHARKTLCICQVFWGHPLVQICPALEIQVHRTRMRRTFRSSSLGRHKLGIEKVGEPRYDFVLHVEEVSDGLIKALGPKVIAGFGVDQLYVDPKPVAATLYR